MAKEVFYSGELLDRMTEAFAQHNMEQAQAEAVAIMAELLNCNRVMAQLDRKRELAPELWLQGLEIIERRLNNEPWQYIFKRAYFRDLELLVTPAVLIPRPETELLADWVIDILPEGGKVLDMGSHRTERFTGNRQRCEFGRPGSRHAKRAKHRPRQSTVSAKRSLCKSRRRKVRPDRRQSAVCYRR